MLAVKNTALKCLLFLMLFVSTSQSFCAEYDWAMDGLFNPSFSSMLNGASQFAQYFSDYSAAVACSQDPNCGMPDDPGSGFEVPVASCCEEVTACVDGFDEYITKIDKALYTLYKNERTYSLIMQVQKARMTAMKGAGSMSAAGAAVVARMEVEIAQSQKSFIDKFNIKAQANIGRLNEFLLGLGSVVDQYCEDSNWYQRNGLPLYLHAKTKFPK